MANLARLFDPVLGAERKIIRILGKKKIKVQILNTDFVNSLSNTKENTYFF